MIYKTKGMVMKKQMIGVGIGLVLCMLANVTLAAELIGSYTYKLVLRDGFGLVLSGCNTDEEDARVTSNYTLEVYNSHNEMLDVMVKDVMIGVEGSDYNCTLTVPVCADGVGCAQVGEQLTLVVRDKIVLDESSDGMRFRSAKVLPPVGGSLGVAPTSVGVFHADAEDVDVGYDYWLWFVELYSELEIGGPDDDFDADGLSNLLEYQLGTDPVGGELTLHDTPEFTITEQGDGYVVEFNSDSCHVYSIRAVGKDGVGEDLELYDVDDHEVSRGKFVYERDASDKRQYFVRKPMITGSIGLAVDGRQQFSVPLGPTETVPVTPGYPIDYATEAAANAAKAIAAITPSEAVAATLTADGAADGYKAAFTVEVRSAGENWQLLAELTPKAWTNLMENATAATRQIPVGELAKLPTGVATNVVLAGCRPGFYYSLCSGATVTNIALDAEAENLNVLCGANGEVTFPKVKKPSDDAGFFRVKIDVK